MYGICLVKRKVNKTNRNQKTLKTHTLSGTKHLFMFQAQLKGLLLWTICAVRRVLASWVRGFDVLKIAEKLSAMERGRGKVSCCLQTRKTVEAMQRSRSPVDGLTAFLRGSQGWGSLPLRAQASRDGVHRLLRFKHASHITE